MNTQLKMRAFAGLLCSLFCSLLATSALAQGGTTPNTAPTQPRATTPSTAGATTAPTLDDWSESDRNLANSTMKIYGNPTETGNGSLTWHNNGPWQTTIVTRSPRTGSMTDGQMGTKDGQGNMNTDNTGSSTQPPYHAFQQTITYKVPADYYDDLEAFDKSIIVDRDKGTLSFYGDQEALNYLSLNLVNDVVTGKRTAAQARAYYDQTAAGYAKGEKSPYTAGLTFRNQAMQNTTGAGGATQGNNTMNGTSGSMDKSGGNMSTQGQGTGTNQSGTTQGTSGSNSATTPTNVNPPVNGNQPAMQGSKPAQKSGTTTTKSKTKKKGKRTHTNGSSGTGTNHSNGSGTGSGSNGAGTGTNGSGTGSGSGGQTPTKTNSGGGGR